MSEESQQNSQGLTLEEDRLQGERSISEIKQAVMDANDYVTFFVGGQFIGVPISVVQEVLLDKTICPVPSSPDTIAGIFNLRGQIVTVIDMHVLLKMDVSGREGREYMHVIIKQDLDSFSFQVDDVGDVLTIPEEELDHPPTTMTSRWQNCCTGVYHTNKQMLTIIDINALIQIVKDDVG